jgi:hypothetical protein
MMFRIEDIILWNFEKNRKFSMKSLYNALTKNDAGPSHRIIWKGKVPQKIKFFMCLMTNNAVLTKDNLIRRKWSGSPVCHFCDQNETVDHLFFTCPTAKVIWAVIAKVIGANNIPTSLAQCWEWCEKWLPAGKKYNLWSVSAICWAIWKGRNKACFDGIIIKNPTEILWHAGALMRFWTGLYAEVEREMLINGGEHYHYRSRLLCRGSKALGKASKAFGKVFAERSSRQSALGENPIGKGFFAESRLSGTQQSHCRVPDARQSAK